MSGLFIRIVSLEIKILTGSGGFRLAAGLTVGLALVTFLLAGQIMSGAAQTVLPVLLYGAAEALTRDRREDFAALAGALPYNSWLRLSGQALAIFTAYLGVGAGLLLITLTAAATGLPIHVSLSACWAFILKYAVACLNAIGIACLAVNLTKSPLRLYGLLAAWWLAGVFMTSNTGSLFPQWLAITNFTFIHGFGGNPSETAGIFPKEKTVGVIIIFQVICSLLLVWLGAVTDQARRGARQRFVRTCLTGGLPCLAGIIVVFVLVYQYVAVDQATRPITDLNAGPAVAAAASPGSSAAVSAAGYNIYVQLDTAAHTLTAQTELTLKNADANPPQALEFTLLPYLKVQQVTDLSTGQALPWRQEGQGVTVKPPDGFVAGRELTLGISYSGAVWEWLEDLHGQPSGMVNFVAEPFSCLRGGHAWYPVLGTKPLAVPVSYLAPWDSEPRQLTERRLVSHDPVPLHLTVETTKKLAVLSNVDLVEKQQDGSVERHKFFSPAAREVFLLAGPYEVTRVKVTGAERVVSFYHLPGHNNNLQSLTNGYAAQIDFYETLVPRKTNATGNYVLFEAPRFFTYDSLMRINNLGFIDAVPVTEAVCLTKAVWSPWWSQAAGRALSQARLLNLWWPNCFSQANGDLADGMALYMHILYMEHRQGKKFYDEARTYWLGYNDGSYDNDALLGRRGQLVQEVFLLLDAIRTSSVGDEGVKQFLRIVHARYQDKRLLEVADLAYGLQQLEAGGLAETAASREHINRLNGLAANPPGQKLRAKLSLKLSWDFGTEVKVLQ